MKLNFSIIKEFIKNHKTVNQNYKLLLEGIAERLSYPLERIALKQNLLMAVSQDGSLLAVIDGSFKTSKRDKLHLLNTRTGKWLASLSIFSEKPVPYARPRFISSGIQKLVFMPNGDLIYVNQNINKINLIIPIKKS